MGLFCISDTRQRRATSAALAAPSPLPHDAVMQLVLLFDVGVIRTGPLTAFAVVAAEDGRQLLLGQSVGRQRDGALLRQAPAVLCAREGTRQKTQETVETTGGFLIQRSNLSKNTFFFSRKYCSGLAVVRVRTTEYKPQVKKKKTGPTVTTAPPVSNKDVGGNQPSSQTTAGRTAFWGMRNRILHRGARDSTEALRRPFSSSSKHS